MNDRPMTTPLTRMRFCDLDQTPVRYSIDGLLTDCGNLYISAYQKSGKSTLALHLLKSFDTGQDFIGRKVIPATKPWLYLNLELPQNSLFKYADEEGLDLGSRKLLVADANGYEDHLLDLLTDPSQLLGKKLFRGLGGVIIDPLSPLLAGSGLSSDDNDMVRHTLREINACMKRNGVPQLVVVDHTGHADKGRGRGASSKGDWADVIWNLERDPAEEVGTLRVHGRNILASTLHFRKDGAKLVECDRKRDSRLRDPSDFELLEKAEEENPGASMRALASVLGEGWSKDKIARMREKTRCLGF